jgi:elongation factor Ts
MAEITAAAVKSLRERTNLPMMECKKALTEANGDVEAAIEFLRKAGAKLMVKQAGRATSSGRVAVYLDPNGRVGTMIELQCESAPVAKNDEFVLLANDMAQQLAVGPGADSPEALLEQPSPSKAAPTLRRQFEDLNNKIRERFKLERIARFDGRCAGYVHHDGATGVLLQYEGNNPELTRDICMHIAAMRPQALYKEELDPEVVAKEREILSEGARTEGKPENIIAKMVEGRLRVFYAECCLAEQPFVKDDGKKTVGDVAKAAGVKLVKFVRWELPKDSHNV